MIFDAEGPTVSELARQALSSTRRGYDLLAPKFDRTPFRTPDPVLQTVATRLAGADGVDAALDLCCGTGAALRAVRSLCRRQIVGVDFSRGMLDVARRSTATATGAAAAEWVQADALALPFTGAFDLVVCFGAHGHILERDEPRLIAEIHRVLRPGGRFVFVTSTRPPLQSARYWLARGFNAAMHVRNWLVSPPFVMYYLTFLLPRVAELLEAGGFVVAIHEDVFDRPFCELRLVVATRTGHAPGSRSGS